jgi:hypothetical protein
MPFHVGVGVVFTGAVLMAAGGGGVERGKLFEPFLVIVAQAWLLVVDESRPS